MSEAITGVKRPWEPGAPPDAPPPIYESDETGDGVTPSEPLSSAPPAVPPPPVVSAAVADHAAAAEEHALTEEAAWLRQQNLQLQQQLAQLQQQHMALMAAHQQQLAVRGAAAVHHGAAPLMQPMVPAVTPPAHMAHNPAWTEQVNPENDQTYYWNSVTGESTYTKPPDYNPPGAATVAGTPLLNVKGPPGANLFVVRKVGLPDDNCLCRCIPWSPCAPRSFQKT